MKKQKILQTFAVFCTVLTAGAGTGFSGVQKQHPDTVLTASAAEADYDWGAFLKKSADWFGTSEALKIADECIQYQVQGEGGWQKGMLTQHTGDWAHSTIDNDATTSQIRFLMRSYAATGNQAYYDCAMRGVACLYKMQYSNGGWMQCLNTPGTYHAHITLNDGAYVHVLQIMQDMSAKTGDFTAVSDSDAAAAAQSLEKGIQCLLNMQIKVNGRKTAWCQQHDENNLSPAGARAYELPSICSSESAGVVSFLYQYGKNHPERTDIAEAVNAAIEWFKKVQLNGIEFVKQGDDKVVRQNPNASPLWARFYTLDTEVPLFSDRDGSVHYDVSEISQERRTGYAWYGNWGKNVTGLAPLNGEPVQEISYQGKLIQNLTVHDQQNAAAWSIQEKLDVGSKMFGDRAYTVTSLPDYLTGAEYVQTACNSKTYNGDLAELQINAEQPCILSVFVDMRLIEDQGLFPQWLEGFTQRSEIVTSSNTEVFEIYEKTLQPDETITLGSNLTGQNVVNYFAAVRPEPESHVVPVKTAGDVNCDGEIDVADAVLLACYLAEDAEAVVSDAGAVNADCDGVSGLSSNDVVTILKYVALLIDGFPQ